jgi:hypothetical protein
LQKLVLVVVTVLMVVVSVIVGARGSRAQSPRYMAAADAPGSVWRINMDTGELEHCSLVKGGCDLVDRND